MKKLFTRRWIVISSLLLLLTVLAGTNEARQYYTIERASVTSDEEELTADPPYSYGSAALAISPDGRFIVFISSADNLVPGFDVAQDIYVRDRLLGTTTLASSKADGTPSAYSFGPAAISDDGRYVVFSSNYSDLVPDNNDGIAHAFLKDMQTGEIKLIDRNLDGEPALFGVNVNGYSSDYYMSPDGRYITFLTVSPDMGEQSSGTQWPSWGRLMRYDQLTNTYQLFTSEEDGVIAGDVKTFEMSGDGRFLIYYSRSTPPDTPPFTGMYVRDLNTEETSLINVNTQGELANSYTMDPDMSADGRYVVFASEATNLTTQTLPDCFNQDYCPSVYLRDRDTDADGIYDEPDSVETRLVSVSSSGEPGNDGSDTPSISADGRYIAFNSSATNLVTDDTNEIPDVFVYDQVTGVTSRISIDANGRQSNTDWPASSPGTGSPLISSGGELVAFSSRADDLVPNDTNEGIDLFVAQVSSEMVVNRSLENRTLESGKLPAGLKLRGSSSDKRICNKTNRPDKPDKIVSHKGKCAFQIIGEPSKTAILSQKLIDKDIYPGDTLTLNAWVKGQNLTNDGKIQLKVVYKNGEVEKTFIPLTVGTYDYTYVTAPIITASDKPKKVNIKVIYGGSTGRITVDQLSVLINADAAATQQRPIPLPLP
ncbi:MAG TPA: hypothetical protein VHL11_08100 [Phototrophicaceae bacterium]|jgi:Tol biopolymer transport system component|nr:hypothetical protein [Phototrophicaceae bacterium]